METLKKIEKMLNEVLLKTIIGFSFLADSKYEIGFFFKKHANQITDHLLEQYEKTKKYYKAFKARHKEYINK